MSRQADIGWAERRRRLLTGMSASGALPPVMFRHPVAIEPADIDHMGHVNNAVYLKWVQEAVIDYWRSVAPPEAVGGHLWVALKHEITYLRPTFLQDIVVAEVIAERVQGARAFFRTVVRRGDEVLS